MEFHQHGAGAGVAPSERPQIGFFTHPRLLEGFLCFRREVWRLSSIVIGFLTGSPAWTTAAPGCVYPWNVVIASQSGDTLWFVAKCEICRSLLKEEYHV